MGPQVAEDVRALGALAAHMRRRRFASGALRLDNVKLVFQMGADGNPASAEPHGGLPGSLCLTQRFPLGQCMSKEFSVQVSLVLTYSIVHLSSAHPGIFSSAAL